MKRECPIHLDGLSIRLVCDWYVKRYGLSCTGEQFFQATCGAGDLSHVAAAAELYLAEFRKMDARLTVDPRFQFEIDVEGLVALDQVITFWRNTYTTKNPNIDQLAVLIKTTLAKVKEYDEALRGLSVATTRSEVKPQIEDTPSPAEQLPQPPPSPPQNPAAPPQAPISGAPNVRPPGTPPPNVIRPPGAPAAEKELNLGDTVRPQDSTAETPATAPKAVSEDEAVRALTPPDSKAPMPGSGPPSPPPAQPAPSGPPQKPVAPPGSAAPVPGGFGPPGSTAPPGAPVTPPPGVPGGLPPAAPPTAEEAPQPPSNPSAPPPPNPEF